MAELDRFAAKARERACNVIIYEKCSTYIIGKSSNEHLRVKQMKMMRPQTDFISFSTILRFVTKPKTNDLLHKFVYITCVVVSLFFHRRKLAIVYLSSMKNRLKLLQRISFLLFVICSVPLPHIQQIKRTNNKKRTNNEVSPFTRLP